MIRGTTLVTGASGLVGSAFVGRLLAEGWQVRAVRHEREIPFGPQVEVVDGDLRRAEDCLAACRGVDAVIHAAGVSGGSKKVTVHAIEMFTDSLLMSTQVLEAARLAGVGRFLYVSNSSVYARSSQPLREEEAWGETSIGFPENETGMVKRAGETQCRLYARFTPMAIAIIRAGNAYGPHDNFDLEASHVVPALIRKAVERQDPFGVWGSGQTVRDFIHTEDIARAGLALLGQAKAGEVFPVNVASGLPVSVEELVAVTLAEAGYQEAKVIFGGTAPPASATKVIDVTRMRQLGIRPRIQLREGIRRTIDWYREKAGNSLVGSAPHLVGDGL